MSDASVTQEAGLGDLRWLHSSSENKPTTGSRKSPHHVGQRSILRPDCGRGIQQLSGGKAEPGVRGIQCAVVGEVGRWRGDRQAQKFDSVRGKSAR